MKKISIKRIVQIGLLIVIFIEIFNLVVSFLWINSSSEYLEDLKNYYNLQQKVTLLEGVKYKVTDIWQYLTDASLTKDLSEVKEIAEPLYKSVLNDIDRLQSSYAKNSEEFIEFKELKIRLNKFWEIGTKMVKAYLVNWNEGNKVMENFDNISQVLLNRLNMIVKKEEERLKNRLQEMINMAKVQKIQAILQGIVINLLGIVIILLMFSINLKVKLVPEIKKVIERIAKGELNFEIDIESEDEIGDIAKSLKELLKNMGGFIKEVKEASGALAASAEELSAITNQFKVSVETQTEKATQIASAAEEMSVTVVDIAKNT
ncbi:MAG: methyl-accepting chemotaxis protein, partial [Thermodesulfobacteria bacterium]|nr:methyl-accepting chemotaxis protein [Thermodesulfobacteriota bacterium]